MEQLKNLKQNALMNAINILEKEKKYVQAFDYVEQMIELLQNDEKSNTDALKDFLQEKINNANSQATELIKSRKANIAKELMQRVEKVIENVGILHDSMAKLYIVFYNTMANLYKETKNYTLSLKTLNKAVELATIYDVNENMGVTYMNKSAILSLIGNHDEARTQAERAIVCTKKEIAMLMQKGNRKQNNQLIKEKESLLGYMFFNVGVQEEYLGDFILAQENYQKAQDLTEYNPAANRAMREKINRAQANLHNIMNKGDTPKSQMGPSTIKIKINKRPRTTKQNVLLQTMSNNSLRNIDFEKNLHKLNEDELPQSNRSDCLLLKKKEMMYRVPSGKSLDKSTVTTQNNPSKKILHNISLRNLKPSQSVRILDKIANNYDSRNSIMLKNSFQSSHKFDNPGNCTSDNIMNKHSKSIRFNRECSNLQPKQIKKSCKEDNVSLNEIRQLASLGALNWTEGDIVTCTENNEKNNDVQIEIMTNYETEEPRTAIINPKSNNNIKVMDEPSAVVKDNELVIIPAIENPVFVKQYKENNNKPESKFQDMQINAKKIQNAYKKHKTKNIKKFNKKLILKSIYLAKGNKYIAMVYWGKDLGIKLIFMDYKTKKTLQKEEFKLANSSIIDTSSIAECWRSVLKESKGVIKEDCLAFSNALQNFQEEANQFNLNFVYPFQEEYAMPEKKIVTNNEAIVVANTAHNPKLVKNIQTYKKNAEIRNKQGEKITEHSAAKNIQSLFRLYETKIQSNIYRISKQFNKSLSHANFIFKNAFSIGGRYIIGEISYGQKPNIINLKIFDPQTRVSQIFYVDYYYTQALSIEEIKANILRVLGKIKYNKQEQAYFMEYEEEIKEKVEKRQSIIHLSSENVVVENLIKNNIPMKKIYDSIKLFGKIKYEISIWLNIKGEIEIKYSKDGKSSELLLKHNYGKYFFKGVESDYGKLIGKIILDSINLNEEGFLFVIEAEIRKKIVLHSSHFIVKHLSKIQAKIRTRLSRVIVSELSKINKKNMSLLVITAVRLGKQTHLIKVFERKGKNNEIFAKSNKANNLLAINYEKTFSRSLELDKEDLQGLKMYIRHQLPKVLAFNPAKKSLVCFKRTLKSTKDVLM